MVLFKQARLEDMIKKFEKMKSTAGLAYFEDDDIKADFRKLTQDSDQLLEIVYRIFKIQVCKSIKECTDLYIKPNSKEENDCVRIIQLFAYELVQMKDVRVLTGFLSLFDFSEALKSRLAHLVGSAAIHNDDDLAQVRRYLNDEHYQSLITVLARSREVQAIFHNMREERNNSWPHRRI